MASPRKRRALKLARAKRLAEAANPQPEPKVKETLPVAPPASEPVEETLPPNPPAPAPVEEFKCDKCDKVLDSKDQDCKACAEPVVEKKKPRTRRARKKVEQVSEAVSDVGTEE